MSSPQKEGQILRGPLKVCNIVGSSVDTINRSDFWHKYTHDRLSDEEYGIKDCKVMPRWAGTCG